MKLVISINPVHVEKLLNGTKKFEYRKSVCSASFESILIYSTAPIKMVVAEAKLKEILTGDIQTIWSLTNAYSGISHEFYLKYYQGRARAVAYHLEDIRELPLYKSIEEIGLKHPPQSYCYTK